MTIASLGFKLTVKEINTWKPLDTIARAADKGLCVIPTVCLHGAISNAGSFSACLMFVLMCCVFKMMQDSQLTSLATAAAGYPQLINRSAPVLPESLFAFCNS